MRDEFPRAKLLIAVLVASALMHLLLWSLGNQVLGWAWGDRALPKTDRIMEVALLDEDDEADPENPAEPPGKLVQLDRVDDERAPDRDTPYVSEFDNRTDKATRAPNVHPKPGAQATPLGNDGRNGKTEDAPRNPTQPQALPLLPSPSTSTDVGDADDVIDPSARGELPTTKGHVPLPSASGSPGARKALLDAIGQRGSHDDIDGAQDDDETSVDSKRWKFSSFFNRVRNAIANHWHPEVVHAANDPDGRRYGTRTRKTRLIITLNPDGSLNRVRLDGSSDIDYLDEEAIHAVRQAAPFANPPPDLVDPRTGLIEFSFGFIFEFNGSSRIFRYQR